MFSNVVNDKISQRFTTAKTRNSRDPNLGISLNLPGDTANTLKQPLDDGQNWLKSNHIYMHIYLKVSS